MSADRTVQQLQAQADAAAGAAVAAAVTGLAARAAAYVPGVAVAVDRDAVRLQAPGLMARAFGNRTRAADPRLRVILGERS